jgi:hypothetical protein
MIAIENHNYYGWIVLVFTFSLLTIATKKSARAAKPTIANSVSKDEDSISGMKRLSLDTIARTANIANANDT